MKSEAENTPVPLQQDVRAIDYLAEFGAFLDKQNLSPKQKVFVAATGREALSAAMERHREDGE